MVNNIKNRVQYKAIDFFCGGGGMTYGLRQAGINVVAGVDFEIKAKETYEYNNPGSDFIHADIKTLEINHFENNYSILKNDDHLIMVGCSPCQYYSIINTSKEKSYKSKDLLLDFQRFVEYYNPGYVLVENVPGIVTNKESALPDFLAFLEEQGYKYLEYEVINMSYYGIPQSRKRFSLIASRVSPVSLPKKDTTQAVLGEFIGNANGFESISYGHRDKTEFKHTVAGLGEKNIKRLARTPKDGGCRLSWADIPDLQLKCFEGKNDSFKDTYGRMWWGKPAPTITTKFFSISNGRFAHPDEDRAISIREGATLQTFPRDYVFKTSSISDIAKLIGNAVPCEYARRLGETIKQSKHNGAI